MADDPIKKPAVNDSGNQPDPDPPKMTPLLPTQPKINEGVGADAPASNTQDTVSPPAVNDVSDVLKEKPAEKKPEKLEIDDLKGSAGDQTSMPSGLLEVVDDSAPADKKTAEGTDDDKAKLDNKRSANDAGAGAASGEQSPKKNIVLNPSGLSDNLLWAGGKKTEGVKAENESEEKKQSEPLSLNSDKKEQSKPSVPNQPQPAAGPVKGDDFVKEAKQETLGQPPISDGGADAIKPKAKDKPAGADLSKDGKPSKDVDDDDLGLEPEDFQGGGLSSPTYDFGDEGESETGGFWGKPVEESQQKPGQDSKPKLPGSSQPDGVGQEKKAAEPAETPIKEAPKVDEEHLTPEAGLSGQAAGEVEAPEGAGLTGAMEAEKTAGAGDAMTDMNEDVAKDRAVNVDEKENQPAQSPAVERAEPETESGAGEVPAASQALDNSAETAEDTALKDGGGQPPDTNDSLPSAAKEPPKRPRKWLRWLSFGLAILIVAGSLFFVWQKVVNKSGSEKRPELTKTAQPKKGGGKLVYWGLWESAQIINPVLAKFTKETGIQVEYVQKNPRDYRLALENAIKEGNGPDVFRFHNTWVPMLKEELDDLPSDVYSAEEFAQVFYPVAVKDLTWQGRLKGVPLEIDGLVLFYNKDLLAKAGLGNDLPTNWDQLARYARQLTEYTDSGQIKVAGAALGTVNNVDHWSDILGLMFYQNGVEMDKLDTSIDSQGRNLAADVLRYYTHFVKLSSPVWSKDLPPSTAMFASGRLVFYFGPSWRAFEFGKNGINFGIMNVPKIPGDNSEWASYWAEGVSATSKSKKQAWRLVKFLSQPENLRLFADEAKKNRLFGEPYPRRDMKEELAKDPYLSSMAQAADNMKSYYFASFTYDQGLNDRINDALGLGVNQVLAGKEPEQIIGQVKSKMDKILGNYTK
ncbi:MAG: extracellular solute-binding protein [bacterium]|nr:extracellular solute-binding protein [bacterium]